VPLLRLDDSLPQISWLAKVRGKNRLAALASPASQT
jgi:hypothetical protein